MWAVFLPCPPKPINQITRTPQPLPCSSTGLNKPTFPASTPQTGFQQQYLPTFITYFSGIPRFAKIPAKDNKLENMRFFFPRWRLLYLLGSKAACEVQGRVSSSVQEREAGDCRAGTLQLAPRWVGQDKKLGLWPKFTISFCSWASQCSRGHPGQGTGTRATAAAASGAAGALLLLLLAAGARHPSHAGWGLGTAPPCPPTHPSGKARLLLIAFLM